MSIAKVHVGMMISMFAQWERLGVSYGYGKKASLTAIPGDFSQIDCSGAFRILLYAGSAGKLIVPDGSQNQREWFEQSGAHQLRRYQDVLYINEHRCFAGFIKPFENGCGRVGHVWLVVKMKNHAIPWTLESHGGGGCIARPWNYPTLLRECYNCFEIPCYDA